MTIQKRYPTLFGAICALILFLAILAMGLLLGQRGLSSRQATRFKSRLLVQEMRMSSDELTRFARTFVATGEAKYERMYADVLAIREGLRPRPRGYDQIYWDLAAAGRPLPGLTPRSVALVQLMNEEGFSAAELAKVQEAETVQGVLLRTERIAMNEAKGLYDDGTGKFLRLASPNASAALAMLEGEAYHRDKARAMRPVNELFTLVEARTSQAVQEGSKRQNLMLGAGEVGFAALILLAAMLARRVEADLEQRQVAEQTALANLQKADTDLKHSAATLTDLARENEVLRARVAELQATGTALRQSYEDLQEQSATQSAGASATIAELRDEITQHLRTAEVQRSAHEKALRETSDRALESSVTIRDLRSEIAQRQLSEESLRQAHNDLQRHSANQVSTLNRSLEGLRQEIAEGQKAAEAVRKTHEEAESRAGNQLAELKGIIEGLRTEVAKGLQEADALRVRREQSEGRAAAQAAELNRRIESLEAEIAQRQQEVESLRLAQKEAHDQSQEQTAHLNRRIEGLRNELVERQQAVEALRQAHDVAEALTLEEAARLHRTIEALRVEIAERQQAAEALRKAHEESEHRAAAETEELNRVITVLKTELAERQEASTALQRAHEDSEARGAEQITRSTARIEQLENEIAKLRFATAAPTQLPIESEQRAPEAGVALAERQLASPAETLEQAASHSEPTATPSELDSEPGSVSEAIGSAIDAATLAADVGAAPLEAKSQTDQGNGDVEPVEAIRSAPAASPTLEAPTPSAADPAMMEVGGTVIAERRLPPGALNSASEPALEPTSPAHEEQQELLGLGDGAGPNQSPTSTRLVRLSTDEVASVSQSTAASNPTSESSVAPSEAAAISAIGEPERPQGLEASTTDASHLLPEHLRSIKTLLTLDHENVSNVEEPPPVDESVMEDISDGHSEQLRELVSQFLMKADQLMAGLDVALGEADPEGVGRLSRELAGMSAACGMRSVASAARNLEDLAFKADLSNGAHSFGEIQRQLKLTQWYLRHELHAI